MSGILKPQTHGAIWLLGSCNTTLDSTQMASEGALHWGTGDLLRVMRATD